MNNAVFSLENVSKSFRGGDGEDIHVLNGISLSVYPGDTLSITGKSGCGKSTLLSVAALIEKPDSGHVSYRGRNAEGFSEKELAALRRKSMGFVFQNSMLLDDFSLLENVTIPLMIKGYGRKEAREEAEALLSELGLSSRFSHRPSEVSGGERQRCAIARAVAGKPDIVFADEPTGSLDEESASRIEDLLISLSESHDVALVLVTHNPAFAGRCSRRHVLSHGRLEDAC